MSDETKQFNVRVYGIYKDGNKVLVTDEFRGGQFITKFPGGGLKFGEGIAKCLERECFEEMEQDFHILEHFYTTDYFVASAFNKNHQLISIYYFIEPFEDIEFKISEKKNDFEKVVDGAQAFRWLDINKISDVEFTFSIDKKVGQMLKKQFA